MAILGVVADVPGLVGFPSRIVYIYTNNTYAEIQATGYLNQLTSFGVSVNTNEICLIFSTDTGNDFFDVVITSGNVISAVPSTAAGGVVGPLSSTNNAIVRWNGITGAILKDGPAILTDAGNLTGLNDVTAVNYLTGTAGTFSWRNPAGTFNTTFQAGANVANTTYTLPSAFPLSNGQTLVSTTLGILSWTSSGAGDVMGPASSTDNALARYDGLTGKVLLDSLAILDDVGNLSGLASVGSLIFNGNTFQTNPSGTVEFRNPANTFDTTFTSGATVATNNYTLPTALPTINGQTLTSTTLGVMSWTTNGSGDVVGPASAISGEIVVFDGVTGKLIKADGPRILSGDMIDINNITSGGSISALNFTTAASGTIGLRNPANTFFTNLQSGAVLANETYILPAALPTSNGQVLTGSTLGVMSWTTNGAGDVVGPASSTDNAIVRFDSTTGKLIQNSTVEVSDLGAFTGVSSIVGSGTFTALAFVATDPGFGLSLRNPANTFNTVFSSGAVTSNESYTFPDALPTANNQPLVSSTSGQFRFANSAIVETVVQATSVTMVRNTSYISTNAALNVFSVPLSGFIVGDIFRVVGRGAGGWRIELTATSTATIHVGVRDVTVGQLINSTDAADTGFLECTNATPGSEEFNFYIEVGAVELPTFSAIVTSFNSKLPIEVAFGGTGQPDLGTAHGTLVVGATGTSPIATVSPGTAGFRLTSNGAGAAPTYQADTHTPMNQLEETGTSATMVVNTAYTANNAGLVTFTIPATVPFGSIFVIKGKGAGGWRIQANTGQTVHVFSATSSVAGTVSSTGQYDTIQIDCITADTTFTAVNVGGAGVNVL